MDDLLERIEKLNRVGVALSAERDTPKLLETILRSAKALTGADGGTIYSLTDDEQYLRFEVAITESLGLAMGGTSGHDIPFKPLPLHIDGTPNLSMVVTSAVLRDETVNIADAYDDQLYDFSGTRRFDETTGYRTQSLLAVPMKNHDGDIIGVLQLINCVVEGQVRPFSRESQSLAESLASQAAVALTNSRLIQSLKELFESFIEMIATAIDEKSPYTGGHCRRVPELTMMLAEAAHEADRGPLAEFEMSESDRYELRIAGWLHDCGKVTTPEYVMDKATKLETIFDRIQLVDTRFEALKRERELAHARQAMELLRAGDEAGIAALEQVLAEELAAIDADREFLRTANIGGEFMTEEAQARVRRIGAMTWTGPDGRPRPLLDQDEIYNLNIPRGTLTPEERTVINNHIVATIKMLESLPFPKHLRRVPEYAGGHHERMDGKGYPRGLTREQMSVPARVMAVADIFEALTARDRPYKKGKTLTECLTIMGRMMLDNHIDPDLFNVFIDSRVYRRYADQFLEPEQIDEVDLSRIPGYLPPDQREPGGISSA